jgi:ABC-type nitrate/sulfonate/bicarbonate transport system substrate-binding protein
VLCRAARLPLLLALLAGCVGFLVSCGDGEPAGDDGPQRATLVLDFLPGPVHAGIYRALTAGYYKDEGIDLRIAEPSATADTFRLVESGRAELGIGEGLDVATKIGAGSDVQAILALTQRPLGGLITLAGSGIRSPAELEGRSIGVTGVPSDDAVVRTEVTAAGGDPAKVRQVTIGFGGVKALLAGRVDAFTGFIPADGVQVELEGEPIRPFPLDRFGGPQYPGLVVFAMRDEIAADPELMRGFDAATARGYRDVLANPEVGLRALLDANPGIDPRFARRSLRAHLPLFGTPAEYGRLSRARLQELATFMVAGQLGPAVPPARYGTNRFLPAG